MNSDKVWIFSWIEPLQEFRRKQILDFTNGIKIHHTGKVRLGKEIDLH